MLAKRLHRNGWTPWHLAGAILLVALGLCVTWEAWVDIARIVIRDEDASHAMLVPPVAAWLIWVRRSRLRHLRPSGQWIGPAIVVLGWVLFAFGDSHSYLVFWHGGALLLVVGCLLTVVGRQALMQFLPAFVLLGFMLPVPGRVRQMVAIPMETISAQITQFGFEIAGVAIERSGNMLILNGHDIAIAEACNGLRMVFALVAVSFAFAFGMPLRGYARVLVLLACPVSAIFCNVIRLVPTVWLYGYYPGDFADRFHDLSAWAMLLMAFMLLLGVLKLLRWARVPVTQYALAYD